MRHYVKIIGTLAAAISLSVSVKAGACPVWLKKGDPFRSVDNSAVVFQSPFLEAPSREEFLETYIVQNASAPMTDSALDRTLSFIENASIRSAKVVPYKYAWRGPISRLREFVFGAAKPATPKDVLVVDNRSQSLEPWFYDPITKKQIWPVGEIAFADGSRLGGEDSEYDGYHVRRLGHRDAISRINRTGSPSWGSFSMGQFITDFNDAVEELLYENVLTPEDFNNAAVFSTNIVPSRIFGRNPAPVQKDRYVVFVKENTPSEIIRNNSNRILIFDRQTKSLSYRAYGIFTLSDGRTFEMYDEGDDF